ncbi:hypothetical protein [Nonomuraea africana]|uniref:Uncharacterized protein n=1 Tax=Nonomuraea africana TaxID=46171 RepID=A0ABR9KK98_9ACTN|nr:hypothetical protein [Nonomuraea africana]MBE1562443.1 hypothetical protein [Nonomuraea africana]
MAKTPKTAPKPSATARTHRERRRSLLLQLRLAVQKDKADRAERHAGLKRQPRQGTPRTRRASRR